MSDYLTAQKAISFSYDASLQVVTNTDQKLGLASSGTVTLSRPDKVRTARSGGFVDVETVFDGKTLTLLGKNANKYTQVEIPGTVDHLVDELKDKYGLPLPAADLLLTNSYDDLMEGVYDFEGPGKRRHQWCGMRFSRLPQGRGGFPDLDRPGRTHLPLPPGHHFHPGWWWAGIQRPDQRIGRPGMRLRWTTLVSSTPADAEKIDVKDLKASSANCLRIS